MGDVIPVKRGVTMEEVVPPGPYTPYGACFVFNRGGHGRIRFVGRESSGEDYTSWLTVNGVPILSWLMENSCPTCEQILQSGNSAFDTHEALSAIRAVKLTPGAVPGDWCGAYDDLLSLFDEGLYFLAVNNYYPTDGTDSLFWGRYETPRVASAINYDFPFGSGHYPFFLSASQSTGKYSDERYERARNRYGTFPGIAFHLEGYLSILLDGHHRALAAAGDGETFPCVTIARTSWYWTDQDVNDPPSALTGLFGCEMDPESLSRPASRWLAKVHKAGVTREPDSPAGMQAAPIRTTLPGAFQRAHGNLPRYPTVENVSAALKCPEVSDGDIETAFTRTNAYPDLATIMNAVAVGEDRRARDLALRIVRDENWRSAWLDALQYLQRFSDDEVLALFWDLALREDIDHAEIIRLTNRYLEHHAQEYE